MRINIYCNKIDKGKRYLEEIMKDIPKEDIVKYRVNACETSLELTDGTIYRVILATDSARGNKCNFAYVDSCIKQSILNTIILPTIIIEPSSSYVKQTKYF